MSQWQSALRYNLVSAQIAGLHYLYILVVYLLHSSTLWHKVFIAISFLTYFTYAVNRVIHSMWSSRKHFIFDSIPKEEVHWGEVWWLWGHSPALIDLCTCRVIVHRETDVPLRHSVEELRFVERRSRHYHAVSVIVIKQCPSAC